MEQENKINIEKKDISSSYEITADGSLGLLALGAVGVIAWKKKKQELMKDKKENKKNE